ncbi:MAG TPA: head GIN domain-containing protein [Dyadobacter sp.]|nr:head GIN domain-containing protein [Dyadobacter sp.]
MKQTFLKLSLALSIAFVFQSCVYINKDEDIPPRGETTRTYDFRNFDELEVSDAIRVHVIAGTSFSVEATGERNDLDDLNIFVQDGKLTARYNNSWRKRQRMDIDITMPDLAGVDFSGAVDAEINDFENLPSIEIELSGASHCDFEGSGTTLKFDLNGASQLNAFGKMKFLDGEASGASQLNAFELETEESDLDVSGASNAKVWVTRLLDVKASGASNVRYRGNPKVEKEVTGGSSVRAD